MANTNVDTDVLVCGAGPVGLFMANECARRRLRWRLIEKRSSQSIHSKALAIFPRTLEIFDMAGVIAPFLEAANRVTAVSVITHGRTLAHMQFEPKESPYPFIAMVPQDVTEQLLLEELKRKGGTVEYETELTAAEQHDGFVTVTMDHHGQAVTINSSFVIGCDGAHSTVRHLLNLSFEGGAYGDSFLLADVESNDSWPANELQLCPSELGPLAIFPMSASRRRVIATIESAEGDAPSIELIRDILAQRAPAGFEARALYWSSYFRIYHRHVEQLRAGSIFIAGDAAHIHSPFGGQGMNTGLHDIWNLVWKLDLFLNGVGNNALLDSYSSERLPVIKNVIKTTDMLTKVMGTPNKFVQSLRDTFIPMVSRLAPFQHAFVERLSELGIAYKGSPIVQGDGDRYFDDSLRGGKGILHRYLLLLDSDSETPVHELAKQLVAPIANIVELRTTHRPGVTLVRPDGYIAFAADGRDMNSAMRSVRSLLQGQTSSISLAADS
jgi:2-polyprenyl-6-methoxyphenol hydroxylase-like FAD-dependent oxidoreductase